MKFRVITLGCKVNTYESEAIKQLLILEGYEYTREENADIVIINTCSVTSQSDVKCRHAIKREIKHNNGAIIVVMGCYAQMANQVISNIEGVSIIVGTNMRHKIPKLIEEYKEQKVQINLVEDKIRHSEYETLSVTSYSDNTRAFVKIQDGCDNFCSYCIIPYARGRMRSRKKEDVLNEISGLVNQGYKEIVLTGIHTAGYGRDFSDYRFDDLLEDILKIPNLARLRISSIEESEISKRLISLMSNNSHLANHLHIPLQSGCDSVLKRMNRKYNCEEFYEKISMLYDMIPNLSITTDIIVGFPGESDEEFLTTYEFAKKCKFAKIHVFPFSPRSGTPASRMSNQIDPKIKKSRVHQMLELSKELEENYSNKFIGLPLETIFEEFDENTSMYKGHSSNYLEVYYQSDEDIRGKMLNVEYKKLDSVK